MNSEIVFNIDKKAASLYIMKVFFAKPTQLWKCFTEAEQLEKWWAPKPWKCETTEMTFKSGGNWRYTLISPENENHQGLLKYNEINPNRSFDFTEYFINQKGDEILELPSGNWLVGFTGVEEGTKLTINIQFNSTAELDLILEMDFENGFNDVLNQLEDLLQKKD